jgi:uncharacterized protein YukE
LAPPLRDAEPIQFDFEAARTLAARFRATADLLRSQVSQRDSLASVARKEWEGVYAGKFDDRMGVCRTDAGRLATALDDAARQVDELARLAQDEQNRRAAARAWKVKHDAWEREQSNDGLFENAWDAIAGDDEPKPPNLTPNPPPSIPIAAPAPAARA